MPDPTPSSDDRPTLSAMEDVPLTFDAGPALDRSAPDRSASDRSGLGPGLGPGPGDAPAPVADVALRLAEGPGTWVEAVIAAPIETVWDLVSDIDLPGRFSAEFLGAEWQGEGPALGAAFVGRNRHPDVGEWEITSFLHAYEPGRTFGWATVDVENPGSRWRFDLEPTEAGTRLRFSLSLGPGPSFLTIVIDKMPDKEDRIIRRRLREHHANMARTIAGIAALAEGAGDPADSAGTADAPAGSAAPVDGASSGPGQ